MYSLYTLLRHGTHQYDCHQFITIQDEVNYAVSEREDEVKDVRTLTRMKGCTGLYWYEMDCN